MRVDENKTELFRFLADEAIKIDTEKIVVSSRTNVAITNGNSDLSFISPCCQEEADTRLFLHVKDASRNGYSKFAIRTVDTDVVIIALGLFEKLNTQELWIAFGTGKHFRYIAVHSLAEKLGKSKCVCFPMFHAFTGCDQVSFFSGKGKKTAWDIWKKDDDVTSAFLLLSECPSLQDMLTVLPKIETLRPN